MTPILFSPKATTFTDNGLGRLSDCVYCRVTEERNGIFECELQYPVTGAGFDLIQEGCIIGVTHDDTKTLQPFDIYARSAPINGLVTFYAHHISYRLSNIIMWPTTASNCAQALAAMATNTYNPNPFTFWTDKNVSAEWKNETPMAVKALLGGQEGSILDVYGTGEYKWDGWTVKLYLHRGNDNNVQIRYGVNLSDLNQEYDISGTYSAVAPYWKGADATVYLPEGYVVADEPPTEDFWLIDEDGNYLIDEDGAYLYADDPIVTPVPMDLSGEFTEPPTPAQLRAKALSRLNSSQAWLPDENLKISFVDLSQIVAEYGGVDLSALYHVNLCDTVTVYDSPLGISGVKLKVVRTVYDTLLDRYESIELGKAQSSFADVLMGQVANVTADLTSVDYMQSAVQHATDLIAGGLGGYVVINRNAAGIPQEILIMDTDSTETARNVWRWNKNGLGHSHNGYNGPFDDVAITQDGQINASMITAGTFNANLIRAGIIQDVLGRSYWNLISGALNVVGTFAAELSSGGHTYRMALTDGGLELYRDGSKKAEIKWNELNSGADFKGSVIRLNAGTGSNDYGATITVDNSGNIDLRCDSLSIGPADPDELGEGAASGTITFDDLDGFSHTITVVNGIVTQIN